MRMNLKRYIVTLTADERQALHDLIAAGKAAAQKLAHARILLRADAGEGGPAWPDHRIAEALEVGDATIERVRQRFVEQGLEAALVRKPQARPSRLPTLDGRAEARLSPWPAPPRPMAGRLGRCRCWPTSWSSFRSSPRSPTRR